MWGSMLIGDVYDSPLDVTDNFSKMVIQNISQHPHFQNHTIPLESSTIFKNTHVTKNHFLKMEMVGLSPITARMPILLSVCVEKCAVMISLIEMIMTA